MNTTPEQRAHPWTLTDELIAQAVEEIGLLAADHRRKKPRTVARPDHVTGRRRGGVGVSEAGMEHAFAVLAATSPGG